jgi:hypothetical protein
MFLKNGYHAAFESREPLSQAGARSRQKRQKPEHALVRGWRSDEEPLTEISVPLQQRWMEIDPD